MCVREVLSSFKFSLVGSQTIVDLKKNKNKTQARTAVLPHPVIFDVPSEKKKHFLLLPFYYVPLSAGVWCGRFLCFIFFFFSIKIWHCCVFKKKGFLGCVDENEAYFVSFYLYILVICIVFLLGTLSREGWCIFKLFNNIIFFSYFRCRSLFHFRDNDFFSKVTKAREASVHLTTFIFSLFERKNNTREKRGGKQPLFFFVFFWGFMTLAHHVIGKH